MICEKNIEINQLELNHPWHIYPNAFMSEYNNYNLYRNQTKKLNIFIGELIEQINSNKNQNIKSLISFQLGSPMEDILINHESLYSNIFQCQQLCPNYINNFINLPIGKKFIQIIIISPDKLFEKSNYIPLFIKLNLFVFSFEKINDYEYLCTNGNNDDNENIIKINIFNCPFPHLDNRKNIIDNYNRILKSIGSNPYEIDNFKPSPNDELFIDNFYSNISELFENNLSESASTSIIINSWVSFKNLYGIHNNYNMFDKLLVLANKYNIIATEWDFNEDCFFCKIISQYVDANKYSCKFKNILYVCENLDNFEESILFKYDKIVKIFGLYIIQFNSFGNIILHKL